MIPLFLKISGIFSYREMQEIDFRVLTSTHLFGIFGAVGSGKSALLEAIMFALYGETERLNSKESRAYNLMNLKSNEAFIQFDFQAPGNKGAFRAVARGKRNSRNKEDVKFDRTLYRLEGSNLVPLETGEITSILGISYDNFRRTIIIPQGKFQEFLQLTSKERTDMVKELFNLHRFDLSFNTSRLQKRNDEALNRCIGRLQQLGEISEEAIGQNRDELQLLILELENKTLLLQQMEAREQEMARTADLSRKLAAQQSSLDSLLAAGDEIREAEQRLYAFDECVREFKSDIELLDAKQKQYTEEEIRLTGLQEQLQRAFHAWNEAEQGFKAARITYDARESLLQRARELDECARINECSRNAAQFAERIRNGEKRLSETQKNLESLKEQGKLLQQSKEALKLKLPDPARLQKAREWHTERRLLAEKVAAIEQQINDAGNQVKSISEDILNTPRELVQLSGASIREIPSLLLNQRALAAAEMPRLRSQLKQLELQEQLKSFADTLKEGEPCPLCGSEEHPHILHIEQHTSDLSVIHQQIEQKEKLLRELDHCITRTELLLENLRKTEENLPSLGLQLEQARMALQSHEQGNPSPETDEKELNQQWDLYTRIQQELEKLDGQLHQLAVKTEEENGNASRFQEALNGIRKAYEAALQEAELLKKNLVITKPSEYEAITSEALTLKAAELRTEYQKAGDTYLVAEKERNERQGEHLRLKGSVQNLTESNAALKNSMEEIRKQLAVRMELSKFRDEASIRSILRQTIDHESELKRIHAYKEQLSGVSSSVRSLEEQLKGTVYDAAVHQQLIAELSEGRTSLDKQKEKKGALERDLREKLDKLQESQKLKSELKALEIRRDNIKILSDLFRGQGFVNYVSTVYLHNLVTAANERFYRLTRQQLKLELDPENNFRIRDYLNEGQWRNVKTLSGGQTFQASLCLALALADNIQQLNEGGQNFFFLDEGFGTLDRESLEQVFDTLKALRRENRIVGVISHVEEMQQEIGAWLRVSRDDERGSLIQASWV